MRIIVNSLERRSPGSDADYAARVLVVNRFRDPDPAFRADLEAALAVLSAQTGCEDGRLGRNVDDPSLWVMVSRWRDVGSYRRALSSYDVKVGAVPLLSRAIDEPSAFEDVDGELNESIPRSTT
ncbi:MAG: antibiotic biosynthesis monooxygenase [Propionibacteriales bacterium]|nr:antibiotic biosynthesis monooxygenase [Propionibacteriales bacterium]